MKTANLSRDDFNTLAQELSQYLPAIADGVDIWNRDIAAQLGGITEHQEQTEIKIREDLKTMQTQLTQIRNTQVLIDNASQSSIMTRRQQHTQLQSIMQSVESISRAQQEELQNTQGGGVNVSTTSTTMLQLVGNGIAGAIGGMVTLLASGAGIRQKHSTRECESSENDHKVHVENAGDSKAGGAFFSQANEAKGAEELVHSNKYTNAEHRTTSEPF
jgi:hypothetical protein